MDGLWSHAARLRSSAERLERLAHDLVRTVDETTPSWSGEAAERAREAVAAERASMLRVVDLWTSAAGAVGAAATHIGDLRSRILLLADGAPRDGLRVDDAGEVTVAVPMQDLVGWARARVLAPVFELQISGLLSAIDRADRDAAGALAAAAGDEVDVLTLMASVPDGDGIDLTQPGPDGFRIGAPDRPTIDWDEDYVWGSATPTAGDWTAAAQWRAKMAAARLVRGDLDDALDAYSHYWSNTGELFTIDYDRASRQDAGIEANVRAEIARAVAGADRLASGGVTEFAMTGGASATSSYPVTENWQKTVGGYQQWSSADVVVHAGTVSMTVTVHAEDYYNFNRGQADIASGAPDDENGRFTEVGWARPFPTTGSLTRTVTWPLGAPGAATTEPAPNGADR
ncbi:hypothetical protein [Cellulomonas sp. C5510]|uniref:hypothetical protein n=1 Tax=Cellulomonas sp. C5510 TaxID=2871170 RepID=UPI001C94101C|nr:hypothetical protein [Cellulomonas sp. C5510]QZN86248.1 hypothetical protein K5O09_03365 [Cellulomonas sp. C5510]